MKAFNALCPTADSNLMFPQWDRLVDALDQLGLVPPIDEVKRKGYRYLDQHRTGKLELLDFLSIMDIVSKRKSFNTSPLSFGGYWTVAMVVFWLIDFILFGIMYSTVPDDTLVSGIRTEARPQAYEVSQVG